MELRVLLDETFPNLHANREFEGAVLSVMNEREVTYLLENVVAGVDADVIREEYATEISELEDTVSELEEKIADLERERNDSERVQRKVTPLQKLNQVVEILTSMNAGKAGTPEAEKFQEIAALLLKSISGGTK